MWLLNIYSQAVCLMPKQTVSKQRVNSM